MQYVYILQNEMGEIYYGCTQDLKKRILQHNTGVSLATKNHKWKLVYYEAYRSSSDAFRREKQLKHQGQALGQLKRRITESMKKS